MNELSAAKIPPQGSTYLIPEHWGIIQLREGRHFPPSSKGESRVYRFSSRCLRPSPWDQGLRLPLYLRNTTREESVGNHPPRSGVSLSPTPEDQQQGDDFSRRRIDRDVCLRSDALRFVAPNSRRLLCWEDPSPATIPPSISRFRVQQANLSSMRDHDDVSVKTGNREVSDVSYFYWPYVMNSQGLPGKRKAPTARSRSSTLRNRAHPDRTRTRTRSPPIAAATNPVEVMSNR